MAPSARRRARHILRRFEYPHRPIGSVEALARHLSLSKRDLQDLIVWVGPRRYREVKRLASPVPGVPDKVTYNPHPRLKELQRRLVERLLASVMYPAYVVGGVKGRNVRHALERHTCGRSMLGFDITRFFESTDVAHVRKVYRHLLCTPPEVEEALVALTTINGHLPRGAPTSSYLANLVLFADEPGLVAWLEGYEHFAFRYTRWVDDIIVTSRQRLTSTAIAEVKSRVATMLRRRGLRLAKEKCVVLRHASCYVVHGVEVRGRQMSIAKAKRRRVRAGVQQLVNASRMGPLSDRQVERLHSLQGTVAYIHQFHPEQMEPCRSALTQVREQQAT